MDAPGLAPPTIHVVGLGPAGVDHLDPATVEIVRRATTAFVRTRRHPAAAALHGAESFDHLYEESATFDEVYGRIVDALVAAAGDLAAVGGSVVYAVPGSPLVAERTVELLRRAEGVDVVVSPALSFLDLAWARLGIDPVSASVRLVDATDFALDAAGDTGPMLVAQCWSTEVLSDVKLSIGDDLAGREPAVTLLHHLGLPDEQVVTVPWWELDRTLVPDHLTSLWIPRLEGRIAGEIVRLEALVRTLRQRCPWDREQTHASLSRHLLEEAYEVVDAIDAVTTAADRDGLARTAADEDLCEELGDVLFQVVFHSVLAGEEGRFSLADVADGVHDKLVGRHPHVFGDVTAETPEVVAANWEVLKKAEKGRSSVTDGIPSALPSLALASKLLKKAAAIGLDEDDPEDPAGVLGAAVAALADPGDHGRAEPAVSVGTALFALARLARMAGVDPEEALRATALAFRDRIVAAEGGGSPGERWSD